MGIVRVEAYLVTLRFSEPFRIAPGTSVESRNVLVRIVTDYGVEGWGEASPSKRVTSETVETVFSALSKIAPRLIGLCPLRIEHIVEVMDNAVEGNNSAKAAVDIALHDIIGKTVGKPLFMILGGYRKEV
jgi:L-alanine-DL-glutamate epimerase-like enolase superfamily enzyme